MKKLILLVIILAAGAVALLHFGPSFVEKQTEQQLSKTLKTPVKVIGTQLDILNNSIKFKAIAVKNYPAIKIKNTLILSDVIIKVTPSSLFSEEIIVEKFSFAKAKIKFSDKLPLKTKRIKFKGFELENIVLRKQHIAEDLSKEVSIVMYQEVTNNMPIEHKAFESAVKAARDGKNLIESGKAYLKSDEFKADVEKGKKAANKFFNKLGNKLDNLNKNIDKHYEMHEGNMANTENTAK